MPAPSFNVGDRVVFTAPFDSDTNVYSVYGVQYIDPVTSEFTDQVTEVFQYRLATGIMNSVEDYLAPAPASR